MFEQRIVSMIYIVIVICNHCLCRCDCRGHGRCCRRHRRHHHHNHHPYCYDYDYHCHHFYHYHYHYYHYYYHHYYYHHYHHHFSGGWGGNVYLKYQWILFLQVPYLVYQTNYSHVLIWFCCGKDTFLVCNVHSRQDYHFKVKVAIADIFFARKRPFRYCRDLNCNSNDGPKWRRVMFVSFVRTVYQLGLSQVFTRCCPLPARSGIGRLYLEKMPGLLYPV